MAIELAELLLKMHGRLLWIIVWVRWDVADSKMRHVVQRLGWNRREIRQTVLGIVLELVI